AHARTCGFLPIDFATSRADSAKRSTIGLTVRFFNVTRATGIGWSGTSTGTTANPLCSTQERGRTVRYGPFLRKYELRCALAVTIVTFGSPRPRALNSRASHS